MKKYIFTILLLTFFIFTGRVLAEPTSGGYVFHGYAQINDELKEENSVLKEEVGTVKRGHQVKMVVSNIINTEKSDEGDEFFAEISEDVTTPNGVVFPAGSVAHGTITEIVEAKHFSRDANVTLNFDYIATPDGREIPIKAKMTTKRNPAVNALALTGKHVGYTAAGGAVGGILALNTFGLAGAVASHGYTVAGGAAIGGTVGLIAAMSRKGDEVLLAQGDEITVKITDSIELPVFNERALIEEEIRNDALLVKITSVRLEKDPFGEPNTITVGVTIVNKTNKTYSTFDMALMNENKIVYHASPIGDTELWFKRILPQTRVASKVSFCVDNPRQRLWLVFFDSRSRQPVVKLSLNNTMKELEKQKKKKR